MAERIVSPGVFTRERDLSFLPQGIGEIGAAILGPTQQGPSFVPTVVTSFQDFERIFGSYSTKYYIPYTIREYLRSAGSVTVVRVGYLGGYKVSSFNGDISNWNVSSVTDMSNMFQGAEVFNQDISSWDVSGVKYMRYMFVSAEAFNQDISSWDVSSVTNMSYLFDGATNLSDINKSAIQISFSSNSNWPYSWTFIPKNKSELQTAVNLWISYDDNAISTYDDINTWDTRLITDMSELFKDKTTFDNDISKWDVSGVINMSNMFNGAEAFNQDISSWDVSNVTNMSGMFCYVFLLNNPLNNWNVSNVTNMECMFFQSSVFNKQSNWFENICEDFNYDDFIFMWRRFKKKIFKQEPFKETLKKIKILLENRNRRLNNDYLREKYKNRNYLREKYTNIRLLININISMIIRYLYMLCVIFCLYRFYFCTTFIFFI